VKIHESITLDRVVEAVERHNSSLDNPGFCNACGIDEPDMRKGECESCGEKAVYGAEEFLIRMQPEGSSEFHEKSAEHYRRKSQRPLANTRRMDELTEWHEDRAQKAREREEKERTREGGQVIVPFAHELASRCDEAAAKLEADLREWQRLLVLWVTQQTVQVTHAHMAESVALLRVAAGELRGVPSLPPRPPPIPNPRLAPPDSPF
jgi:hypothetical protein